ncbi:insulinase family protein [Ignatzschineria rhizosphaerae]|uniref:Insulinase family protein n=1 Tax=Ignatzschineria rhizosphaerae TaxID=2923279 RepID=A0ABY3X0P8_9GAMM|nr:pitrilysin family protein [Ignatzschineria rhizosphaerae]UNM96458.1 insulinase family protein [Ignatzschineria rhizosphaerae]
MKNLLAGILATSAFLIGLTANGASQVETWKTKEGASVYFLQAPEIPIMDMIVSLDAGSLREGNQYGLASMTANMMTKGTSRLNEEDFLTKLDDLQSSINAGSSLTSTNFSLRSLTKETSLKPSLELFYEVLMEANFNEKVFERERAQAIDGQKAILDNPGQIANELYYETLYPNTVVGATSKMLEQSLKSLTMSDLEKFRTQFYHANNAKIVFVGDISKEDAEKIATHISGLLGQGEVAPLNIDIKSVTTNKTVEQAFNSPQTQVIMGQPAIDRFNKDYLPLIVGNHLLGGSGLTSILMTNIREKDGLTYGIYSYFAAGMYEGPFTVSFSTKNESVEEAIEKSKAVITKFIAEGPEEDALQRAKNNFLGALVLDLNSNAKLANAILGLANYNLPLDYYETLPEKVKAITPAEIQSAFKRHVNPKEMATVIVGGYVEAAKTEK